MKCHEQMKPDTSDSYRALITLSLMTQQSYEEKS